MNTTDQYANRSLMKLNKGGLRGALALLLLLPVAAWAGGVVTTCTEAPLRAAIAGGGTVTFACEETSVNTNTNSRPSSQIQRNARPTARRGWLSLLLLLTLTAAAQAQFTYTTNNLGWCIWLVPSPKISATPPNCGRAKLWRLMCASKRQPRVIPAWLAPQNPRCKEFSMSSSCNPIK